ncbi:hypothetical protein M422DRAFT_277211 [Sphaerobolus stellatus SS14]|uniref:Uncharacterized protein n=1 Tax=Sphaerobolus stellatus (strain SS14) TaxID=990650 RepID=A0A0C9T0Y4_SPHS4|nr:hypothetical protein M422DRAFT_277211 [Sphaerobolus stellatus SS14]
MGISRDDIREGAAAHTASPLPLLRSRRCCTLLEAAEELLQPAHIICTPLVTYSRLSCALSEGVGGYPATRISPRVLAIECDP